MSTGDIGDWWTAIFNSKKKYDDDIADKKIRRRVRRAWNVLTMLESQFDWHYDTPMDYEDQIALARGITEVLVKFIDLDTMDPKDLNYYKRTKW